MVDANYGIPTKCACGQPIEVETAEQGRHYYVCKHELTMLKNDARDEAINRAKLESKIAQIILELAEIKKLVNG